MMSIQIRAKVGTTSDNNGDTGDKSLPVPVITQLTGAYNRYHATMT